MRQLRKGLSILGQPQVHALLAAVTGMCGVFSCGPRRVST